MKKSSTHYRFTEMFRADHSFVIDYRLEECEVITYPTSFPLDALVEPSPPVLTATLYEYAYIGKWHADVISAESSLSFYESGMVKHIYKEWADSELSKKKEGWYDRITSEQISSAFDNINFQEWKLNYTGLDFKDGGGWSLKIAYSNGLILSSKGQLDYPSNWKEVQRLFGLRLFLKDRSAYFNFM